MLYRVWVKLEAEYEIDADSEEEAFLEASDRAMDGGDWDYEVDRIDEDE